MKHALATVLSLTLCGATATPAVAGPPIATGCRLGLACFYDSVWANTRPQSYEDPATSCTALPFIAKALINNTSRPIALYSDPHCRHFLLVEPSLEFHSYPVHDVRAFRAR
ncbi:hypothetical protein [Lentzea sp. NPDC003310]|uniref:hypothetical protein n=1 Tax=Lentzea sp. NPDC003310 TaxID=3154447 RepID=UPI0033AB0377